MVVSSGREHELGCCRRCAGASVDGGEWEVPLGRLVTQACGASAVARLASCPAAVLLLAHACC